MTALTTPPAPTVSSVGTMAARCRELGRQGANTQILRALVEDVARDRSTWVPSLREDGPLRWYEPLLRDDQVDVWLLGWGFAQDTTLHDHGASRGAFTVVQGSLVEDRADDAGRLLSRRVTTGGTVGIERGDVHNVLNAGPGPAVSIHAYSPPLTTMSYYAVLDRLTRVRTVAVDRPEEH